MLRGLSRTRRREPDACRLGRVQLDVSGVTRDADRADPDPTGTLRAPQHQHRERFVWAVPP